MRLQLLFIIGLVFASQTCLSAEIYKWVDKDGNVHYSDSPPPDAETEKITVEDATVKEPDEGELRRRRLLQQTDIDAARLLEERRATRAARQAHSQVTAIEERVCLDARMQLEVLKEQRPVYRDDRGKWRANWQFDTYKGERTYLDDTDRPTALTRARKNVEAHCENPADPQAQAFARNRWIFSERCAAAKADLESLKRPAAKNPKTVVEKQRRLVQLYCEDGQSCGG